MPAEVRSVWLHCWVPFVQTALSEVLEHIEADGAHRGGFFCSVDTALTLNVPTLVIRVGNFPRDRAERRFRLSIEKPTRLLANPTHISSEQSRCDEKEQFGGAIRTSAGMAFSFSGLPRGIDDEAVCLLTAERTGQILPELIERIVAISNNDVYRRIRAFHPLSPVGHRRQIPT